MDNKYFTEIYKYDDYKIYYLNIIKTTIEFA